MNILRVSAISAVTALMLSLARVKRLRVIPVCLLLGFSLSLALAAQTSQAFELRRGEDQVRIAADETVDDTLVVLAETVQIEGTINGDLIALAEHVSVLGQVSGNLVVLTRSLNIEGRIGGTLWSLGETVELRAAALGNDAYGLGRTLRVDSDTTITGNLALAAEEADMQGLIGRDLAVLARSLLMSGAVEGNLSAYAERINLGESARINGNLRATVDNSGQLSRDAEAAVAGESRIDSSQPREAAPNPYLSPDFYLGETFQLAAAFITGLVLFSLFPGMNRVPMNTGRQVLITAGFGAALLIALPALAVAVMLTLIGAPLGILALMAWLASLYIAGIMMAGFLGRRLLADDMRSRALVLLAGLAAVFILINLPFVGGVLHLLVTLIGLGLLARWLKDQWTAQSQWKSTDRV